MIKLSKADYNKIVAHAESELPNEACGLIAGVIDGENKEIKRFISSQTSTTQTSIFRLTQRNSLRQ